MLRGPGQGAERADPPCRLPGGRSGGRFRASREFAVPSAGRKAREP